MKTPFRKTERSGHIDIFYIGSARVSLLPVPPEMPKPEPCDCKEDSEDECPHEIEFTDAEIPEPEFYTYSKIFIRQGGKTYTVEIPEGLQLNKNEFESVFTASYEDLPEYIAGNEAQQWLAGIRSEYLGMLDPVTENV